MYGKPSYSVEGYTYDADVHCTGCAIAMATEAWGNASVLDDPDFCEEHEIGVIFADSESDYPEHCADCGGMLDTSLTGDGVDYIIDALAHYIDHRTGDTEVLDQWESRLQWCTVSESDEKIIDRYRELREDEQA